MTNQADSLFELGHATLCALIDELAARQVHVDPRLELRRGTGLLCYYSLHEAHIYLSVPDAEQPRGKFELFLLRSVIDLASNDEMMRFLELLIPWLIAHEVGHHLRHQYGVASGTRWEEEQIANQLACAFIQHHLTSAERSELLGLMARAMANLNGGLQSLGKTKEALPAQDFVSYIVLHLHWFYLELLAQEENPPASREQSAMDEFIRVYLWSST